LKRLPQKTFFCQKKSLLKGSGEPRLPAEVE